MSDLQFVSWVRINSYITKPGVGTLLFGDKTGLSFASAFDRINVRRLFLTIEQALAHPYMEKLHFVDDEPTGDPVADFDFDFELYSLKIPEYKELIFEEIKLYHDQAEIDQYITKH